MLKKDIPEFAIKFRSVARRSKKQNYFSIPKRYVDDGHVEINAEYILYLEKIEKEE